MRAWIEEEQPDVVCPQELKAKLAQVPASLCELEGYWYYWHWRQRLFGRWLERAQAVFCLEPPAFQHPPFNMEHRIAAVDLGPITVASVYVPNGGKD